MFKSVFRRGRLTRWLYIVSPRRLWLRYVFGFLFIFVTIGFSHQLSLETIQAAEDDAEVLSVSSRQRMLSQRILFLMWDSEYRNDPLVERRLETALNLFEKSHEWLVSQPNLSPALHQLYFEKEPISLDAFSRRFVQMVGITMNAQDTQAEELRQLLSKWGTEDFVAALASAAFLFKRESEERIAKLQSIQTWSLSAALIVLLMEALLIFMPAQVAVNIAITRLEARKRHLKRSLNTLRQKNHDLLATRQKLSHAMHHDPLTGLLNRKAIHARLDGYAMSEDGDSDTCALMKIDLDHFKAVNERLGSAAGDEILKHVASVLTRYCGPGDSVGRINADEFALVIDSPASNAQLQNLATQLITEIRKPIAVRRIDCSVGASIGYTASGAQRITADQLLIEADLALFGAKEAGGGRAHSFCQTMAGQADARCVLIHQTTRGFENGQFIPCFQPQVNMETGALHGCEVLARWSHPDRGLLPPGTFMDALDEAGLLEQLDLLMFEKGLDALEMLIEDGIDVPAISVNAAPVTLRDPYLPDRLRQAVDARHLDPCRLTIEVLESTLIEDENDVILRNIANLSAAGFAIVLDDFGTGYASMSNLSLLRLDGLKIDRSLIGPLPDARAAGIVSALVTLAGNLRMQTVAEGVETRAQAHELHRLGCHLHQGYGIAKPLELAELRDWCAAKYGDDSGRSEARQQA